MKHRLRDWIVYLSLVVCSLLTGMVVEAGIKDNNLDLVDTQQHIINECLDGWNKCNDTNTELLHDQLNHLNMQFSPAIEIILSNNDKWMLQAINHTDFRLFHSENGGAYTQVVYNVGY